MSMTPDLDQNESLAKAFEAADTGSEDTELNLAPDVVTPDANTPLIPAEAPWEAPSWTQRWKPEARDALGRFAANPELKPHFDPLLKQLEGTNGYITQKEQEFSDYRKRVDPLYDVVKPYEQRYALQGMTVQQGVGQLLQLADFVSTNPDDAFPWLSQTYRPKDPSKVLASLAQQWGADLTQVGYEQPYVDPTVTALLNPLQQKVQHFEQMFQQQQAREQQQQQASVLQEITAFESAKDDTGNLLYPHFRDVFDDMLQLVELGRAQDIKSAYELATRVKPSIQEKTIAQRMEAAQKKAIEEAAARTAEANKAQTASRSIGGKNRSPANDTTSLLEAFEKAEASLSR